MLACLVLRLRSTAGEENVPPLIAIARAGNLTSLHAALQASGAALALDETDAQGDTALMAAVTHAHYWTAKTLLEADANPNTPNKLGYSPLLTACSKNLTDIAVELLQKGARIHARSRERMTPALFACRNGNVKLVTAFIALSAESIRATDSMHGFNCLLHAIRADSVQAVATLLSSGADVNSVCRQRKSALMHAVARETPAIAELLLAHGADLTLRDFVGNDAFYFALAAKDPSLLALLRRHRALSR